LFSFLFFFKFILKPTLRSSLENLLQCTEYSQPSFVSYISWQELEPGSVFDTGLLRSITPDSVMVCVFGIEETVCSIEDPAHCICQHSPFRQGSYICIHPGPFAYWSIVFHADFSGV
jgi:hypothetical protein